MRATADAEGQDVPPALSPERRLAAIADLCARGLARALLAQEAASPRDEARDAQLLGTTSESALIDGPERALMVARGGDRAAGQGGRRR
jgi:hypothetical protein